MEDWLPTAGSPDSSSSAVVAPAPPSDWLNSISGPTALITSPQQNQELVITGQQEVLFDGARSQALRGTTLVSFDWQVTGTQDDGAPFETNFLGPVRHILVPAGRYSATLTVQAVRLASKGAAPADLMSYGTDFVGNFVVRNTTAESEASRQTAAEASSSPAAAESPPKPAITGGNALFAAAAASDKDGSTVAALFSHLQQPKDQQLQEQQQQIDSLRLSEWHPESGTQLEKSAVGSQELAVAQTPLQEGPRPVEQSTTANFIAPTSSIDASSTIISNTAAPTPVTDTTITSSGSSTIRSSNVQSGPFSFAFNPVLQQWDDLYGPGSAYYEQLQQQEHDRQQWQLELETLKQILNPPPPPPVVYEAPVEVPAPPAPAPTPAPAPAQTVQTPTRSSKGKGSAHRSLSGAF